MKHTKKFLSLVLALVLALALAMPVMAANEKGSITVNNATVGQTYKIYKIFDLSYSKNGDKEAFSYTVNEDWKEFFAKDGEGLKFVNISKNGYVSMKEEYNNDAGAKAFAEAAFAYLDASKGKITPTATEEAKGESVVFTGIDYGYYLLDSTVGTVLSIDTAKPSATIEDKNEKPSIDKVVEEDNGNIRGKVNDAEIGQTVTFHATITAQDGAEGYVMHDTMAPGLTYTGVTSVKLDGVDVENDEKQAYNVVNPGSDGCTFEVQFTKEFCANLKKDQKIVVTYTAVVNENAVIAGPNKNETKLTYGENSDIESNTSETNTYVWAMNILKHNVDEETLAGAKFSLSLKKDGEPIRLVKIEEAGYTNAYRLAKEDETVGVVTEIETPEDGKLYIEGLDEGTYYLTETEAPDGYNLLPEPITITVTSKAAASSNELTETIKYQMKADGEIFNAENGMIDVLNLTGTELPSTGGIGTTIFYVIGGILVIGAAILLISKRRAGTDK